MEMAKRVSCILVCAAPLLLLGTGVLAQKSQVPSRIVLEVDDSRLTRLSGNIHPSARFENDRGALPDSQPMLRMLLLLQRSTTQEATLRQVLEDQQTKGSPNYHQWLTPEQFGAQFGPSDADLQAVTDWLTRQGFQVAKISTGRTVIEFNGTVAQVRNAFHTEIHRFAVNGKEHFANVTEPAIPEALTPVVKGVVALHNFRKKPFIHRLGKFRRDLTTGQISPLLTYSDVNGTFYGVGPADFAKIYNVPSTWDGSGQSIAIVGRSNINLQDVRDFRSIFGLPAKDPQILLNGPDPGLVSGDEGESDLDVEWAGAVAPGAQIILVSTLSTDTDAIDGVDGSALYIVDNNLAPILSDSYGDCESNLGTTGNAFYNSLWQQAAAEGITVTVAAGDNGAAACDDPNSQSTATGGIAISGLASTPYNIAMGGTDFNQAGNQSTYWNANGTSNVYPSAKGYIPEMVWNDSCAAAGLMGCASVTSSSSSLNIVAASGGPSAVYTTKPKFQTGFGDTARDIPDLSLFAADGVVSSSFYIACESDEDISGDTGCNLTSRSTSSPYHDFQAVGGTSAAAPGFAGIIALVNQKTGQRQGNANYVLYKLANTSGVFHDITTGNNSVPCAGASLDCSDTASSGFGVLTTKAGGTTLAYAAGAGYDLATGLGTVDVTNLLSNWNSPSSIGTTTSLTGPSPSSLTVDASASVSGSVTKTSGTGTPSGVVILENASTGAPIDSFTLDASGNYTGTTTFLPGGNYSVKAHYGGDGTFAPSDSSSTAVNVGKQNSQVIVSWVSFNGNTPVLSTQAQTAAYGSPYILRVDVANAAGTACQNPSTGTVAFVCPTGTVTLLNNGTALNDFPTTNGGSANVANLNNRGFVEDQPIQLAPGNYSITATYSGDASYNAQPTSNTLAVTVTKAATATAVSSSLASVTSGTSVTLTATISTQSNGTGPTGSVTFSNGSTSLGSAACTPTSGAQSTSGTAVCTTTLTAAISSLYPPPFGAPRSPLLPVAPFAVVALSIALYLILLRRMPPQHRRAYAYMGLLAVALLCAGIIGCSSGSGSTSSGNTGSTSTRTITASYGGDTNYSSSTGTTTITVTK